MKNFWKFIDVRAKIAIIATFIAFVAIIIGTFILHDEMRVVTWGCIVIIWDINYWIITEINYKIKKENLVKEYEIDTLKYSYRLMGKYLQNEHHPYKSPEELLSDIDIRIENELRDIDIKTKNYAKSLKGIVL